MKHPTENKTPTPEAIEAARLAAIAKAEAEAKTPEAKREAARLALIAKAKRSEADEAVEAWKQAKREAEAKKTPEEEADPEDEARDGVVEELTDPDEADEEEATEDPEEDEAEASDEDEDPTDEEDPEEEEDPDEEAEDKTRDHIRALYKAAKAARLAADEAEEKAEAAAALANATRRRFDRMRSDRDLAVVVRVKTEADRALTAAKKTANAADEAVEALTADPHADPAAVKAAKKTAKAARAKVTEARKAAAEAAKTAPRFSFFIGYEADEATTRRPTAALAAAHSVAAATLAALAIDPAVVNIRWNVLEHPEAIEAAARTIAKRTAANAIQRQGTPTQFRIDRAARAALWIEDPDLADMVGEAAAALALVLAPEAKARAEAEAAARLHTYAATLAKIDPADLAARAAYIHRITTADHDPRIIDAPDRMNARAASIDLAIEARAAEDPAEAADLAARAAFRAVNNYLTAARKIQSAASVPTVSLEKIENTPDPRPILEDPEALTEYKARRRAIIKAAAPAFFEALTPAQNQTLRALVKAGGNEREAARILKRHRKTVSENKRILTRALAAALAEAAPDSIERRAADLARLTADIEATEAAATIAARKAEAKAAKARKAAAEAAEDATATIAAALAAVKTEAAAEAEADRARRIAAAIAEAVAALPPAMREVTRLIASGQGKREAAHLLGKNEATVREAAKAAARRIAAAIAEAAPDLAIDPAIIARADLAALVNLAARAA